ncbi:MAG: hypothetical protein JWO02_3518 [Solirubrobacterales bacterium]|nr:hypothetical protein [Solirubrobacterales bacterium]
MPQVIGRRIPLAIQMPSTRTAWLGALLASAAVVAIALVLAIGGKTSSNAVPASIQGQPSLRTDGGPEETGVATAVGSRPTYPPDEGRIAAAIGSRPTLGPDEGTIAASIGGGAPQSLIGAPPAQGHAPCVFLRGHPCRP